MVAKVPSYRWPPLSKCSAVYSVARVEADRVKRDNRNLTERSRVLSAQLERLEACKCTCEY